MCANGVSHPDRHISTDEGGGDCYTPAVGQVTIWRCKQTQAGLTESQLYTELHGLTVLYMLTDFHRVTVSICTSHDDSCSLQNL